jgi:hypothetical protein
MKFTGIWFMPLLFHGLMGTITELAKSEFQNGVCPFTRENPTYAKLACQKMDGYQRTGWLQPIWSDARRNSWSRDIEISLSTDVVQRDPTKNRIQVWNPGELEVEYCLRHPPDNTWTDVKRLKCGDIVYLHSSIYQVELHLRKIPFRTGPPQPR